jgi:RNA polymerase sigma-70 factor (ECF subfamily)
MGAKAPAKPGMEGQAQERLLIQAAQKDPRRFGELYELHFERVYGFIARRVRDRHIAEDLTSDVFHKALANLPQFEWRGVSFAAWLLRIAANGIFDRGKKASREVSGIDVEGLENPVSQVDLDEADRRARLFRLVDELPAEQKRVVVMRFAEEKSIRDIARELQKSEGAVKQLQFRGLGTLREWCQAKTGEKAKKARKNTKGKQSGGGNG